MRARSSSCSSSRWWLKKPYWPPPSFLASFFPIESRIDCLYNVAADTSSGETGSRQFILTDRRSLSRPSFETSFSPTKDRFKKTPTQYRIFERKAGERGVRIVQRRQLKLHKTCTTWPPRYIIYYVHVARDVYRTYYRRTMMNDCTPLLVYPVLCLNSNRYK